MAAHGDRMIAAWYGGPGNALGWAFSLDGGQSWSDGGLVDDFLIPGGHAVCADSSGNFYLAARLATFSGETVATYRGSFAGTSFSWQRRTDAIPFIRTDFGPHHLQLECDPSGSPLYLTYTEVATLDGTVKLVRSLDGGQSWSLPLTLSGNRCDDSRAALGPDGELYVVWLDRPLGQILGRKSVDQGVSFGAPFVVAPAEENRLAPVGWENPTGRSYPVCPVFERPMMLEMAVDRSATAGRGRVYVAWTEHTSGTPVPVTGTASEVEPNDIPVQATPVAIGQTVVGSMFGQEGVSGDADWFSFEGQAGTTLWVTGSACGSSRGIPIDRWTFLLWCGSDPLGLFLLDGAWVYCSDACPAYVYTLPATGRYYLDLGSMSDGEISYAISLQELAVSAGSVSRDHRDVVLASSGDGGGSWSKKVRVNDDVGYDNALPAVAVDHQGRVHVAWYDRREEPECSEVVHTRWSYSADGGQSFVPSVRVSTEAVDLRAIRGSKNLRPWVVGYHMALEAVGDEVLALWAQPRPSMTPGQFSPEGDIWGAVIRSDTPTAAVAAAFRAAVREGVVRLEWELREENGVRGFQVHRAVGASADFAPLEAELLPARGGGEYQVEDRGVEPGQRYHYQLEVVLKGGSLWQGPVEVELPGVASRLTWQGASPNPFTTAIALELLVPSVGHAVVAIFDVSGHELRRLHEGPLPSGLRLFRWDGRDRRGRVVPAGIYVARAVVGSTAVTRRVVRLP